MQTMLEALQQLKEMGYTEDFNSTLKVMIAGTDHDKKLHRLHADFVVDKVFRIDEDSDGGGQSVVYAISSRDGQHKGVVVSGYGIYTDEETNQILDEIDRPDNPKTMH